MAPTRKSARTLSKGKGKARETNATDSTLNTGEKSTIAFGDVEVTLESPTDKAGEKVDGIESGATILNDGMAAVNIHDHVDHDEDVLMLGTDSELSSGGSDLSDQIMDTDTVTEVEQTEPSQPRTEMVNAPINHAEDDENSLASVKHNISVYQTIIAQLTSKLVILNAENSNQAGVVRTTLNEYISDLANLNKVVELMENRHVKKVGSSSKVPVNLPKLQWTGRVFDKNAEVYADVNDALRKFKDVMFMHNLDHNHHWRRLLPGVISQHQRDTLEELPTGYLSWNDFCRYFLQAFGTDVDEERTLACNELLEIKMGDDENIDNYVDRFHSLKRKAGITDNSLLAGRFVLGLTDELTKLVNIATTGWSPRKKTSITWVMRAAKSIYLKVIKNK
ncbi:hypothetical protein ABG067_007953, partial [Albugo candida]